MTATRKQRTQIVAGIVALSNSALLLSIASRWLFKHGGEHVFGLQARTWGFVLLGLALLGIGTGIATLVSARKSES